MATKYYTHFVTGSSKAQTSAAASSSSTAGSSAASSSASSEWSGVIELRRPLTSGAGAKELRSLLAQSFDLETDDIKILDWARLH